MLLRKKWSESKDLNIDQQCLSATPWLMSLFTFKTCMYLLVYWKAMKGPFLRTNDAPRDPSGPPAAPTRSRRAVRRRPSAAACGRRRRARPPASGRRAGAGRWSAAEPAAPSRRAPPCAASSSPSRPGGSIRSWGTFQPVTPNICFLLRLFFCCAIWFAHLDCTHRDMFFQYPIDFVYI